MGKVECSECLNMTYGHIRVAAEAFVVGLEDEGQKNRWKGRMDQMDEFMTRRQVFFSLLFSQTFGGRGHCVVEEKEIKK
ncbi:hypothetical protein [Streptomyces javensis]|uniref:Uncharacterized protein n=1 Tax=Streptomyces javensis TaxID=114698 RepID=A0ABS0RT11_9ACTN|nr:hypothetical protein [Streptomyces javensis]MBI0320526.1 hypothetical protein [Streptomyces javensis]